MTAEMDQEKFSFQAEVVQLLDLMINSLYSNKEIFLRELISNSSDAIDRLRLELLSSSEVPGAEGPLQIRVSYDKEARTITVADNGVGMSRAEVIEHIGTIAKSGTREFLQALTGDQRQDATLIGQFGVGFYSAFIVAERVTLTTRRAGLSAEEGVRWESDGRGEYTLEAAELPARGTTIVLHLRDGEDDLLNGYRLRSIITKYSDHISLPIVMPKENAEEGEPAEETINQASALWARPKSEITDQEYTEFYRHISGDHADPLSWVHSKIEGTYEFTLLLFIPARAPYNLWFLESLRGVRLHVRRIFILEDEGQLLPRYLRFVRGVIDSADLPLNVSRELLQGSRVVDRIRSSAVKKILQLLADMAGKEPDKYATFWKEFGAVLKEGIVEDFGNREDIARLLRFTTTRSAGEEADVTLADYAGRMKEGQDKIYYLVAPTLAAAASSPHLEAFRAKGVEVLLLADAVDNWLATSLHDFEGKRLQSVAQGSADLGAFEDEAEKAANDQAGTEFAGLAGRLKTVLDGKAWDVRVTSRLTSSPACIVGNEPELEITMVQRLRGSGLPSQPVLEINPRHPLVERLNRQQDDPRLADWAYVLFNQAVLTLGARIDDPADFVTRLNDLLTALTGEEEASGAAVAEGSVEAIGEEEVSGAAMVEGSVEAIGEEEVSEAAVAEGPVEAIGEEEVSGAAMVEGSIGATGGLGAIGAEVADVMDEVGGVWEANEAGEVKKAVLGGSGDGEGRSDAGELDADDGGAAASHDG
ncbi:MAG: molecular chaperone HtpG [Streptosporangiaceae bacterium]